MHARSVARRDARAQGAAWIVSDDAAVAGRLARGCRPPRPGTWLLALVVIVAVPAIVVAAEPPAAPSQIDDRIRHLIGELGYDDEVADMGCRFVASWNLAAWKQRIDEAKRQAAEGLFAAGDIAAIESEVLDDLQERLRSTIQQTDGMSAYFHLEKVFQTGRSQCVGNAQLLWVFGGAVGLDVRGIDVLVPIAGTLGENMFHLATIVRLADGRVRMVDERWLADSPAFVFAEHFARHGIYWRLIDESNPLGLHRQVRPIDANGMVSGLLVSISSTYRDGNSLSEATDMSRRALELDPDSSYALLALARLVGGRDAEALTDRAVEIDPERAEAHVGKAVRLVEAGRHRDAVAAYDRAIELKPESPNAIFRRAVELRDLGDEDQALADFTACLRYDPRNKLALLMRSDIWLRRQDLAAAQRDCDAAIAIDPEDPDALWRRAYLHSALGRPTLAAADFEAAVSRKQDDATLWLQVATARSDLGKLQESFDAYSKALELEPEQVEALANRACVLLDLGHPAEALADCERALGVDPRHAIALFNRGVSLAHLGRKAEARAAIEESVEADPSSRDRATRAIERFGL